MVTAMDKIEFNSALAKKLKSLKKDIGVTNMRQNYKGTGGNAHRQQIYIRFENGNSIDIFLEDDHVLLGGVVRTNFGKVIYPSAEERTAEAIEGIYTQVMNLLKPLSAPVNQ